MGVYISPVKSSIIRNREVKDILTALLQEDYSFFNTLAESRFEGLGIASLNEVGSPSYKDKVIASVYGEDIPYENKIIAYAYTRDDEDKWHETDGIDRTNDDFPHWADYPTWEDNGEPIEGRVLYVRDPEQQPTTDSYFQMAYSGYGYFRRFIAHTLIGVTVEEVWENPEKYEDNALTLLVNGSDCEGIIVNSVVKRISAVLNDPKSFRKISIAAELIEDSYGQSSMIPRYESFSKMFAEAAQSGFDIDFS